MMIEVFGEDFDCEGLWEILEWVVKMYVEIFFFLDVKCLEVVINYKVFYVVDILEMVVI